MQLYGIDWLATVCGLAGVYLIGSKNKYGFLIMMIASLSWMGVGFMIGSLALILGSSVFFGLHLRGWFKWKRDARELGFLETQQIKVAK
ncbi:MAG TPA: nicotinamide mononucleotide transporter [Pyrinomonadaceae bacterium]|nr:nicotinamide mononucleotide transporter [Pyrinomonadaceae bacterium]